MRCLYRFKKYNVYVSVIVILPLQLSPDHHSVCNPYMCGQLKMESIWGCYISEIDSNTCTTYLTRPTFGNYMA